MSGRRRTTASSAPRCTQSFDNSSIESPQPSTDDRQPLSQTDNRTPVVERRRRLSGAAPLHNLRKPKTIHDRVYGAVTLPGVLVAAMDTSEFQRLDKIRQLGGSYFVFPSATHTRKEHSVGTAHLALLVVRHLRNTQPELAIDDTDELCVGLAALLHDVGHGPYSHMWEPFVRRCTGDDSYSHEGMGARLVKRICKQIKLEEYVPDASVEFICTCIEGLSDDADWPFTHITEDKRFLCDIVSNKRSGLDVDKWDYLNRDSVSTLGESSSGGFDVTRLVSAIRVVRGPSRTVGEVAFEEKVALDLNRIFKLRSEMHQMVYQHRVACCCVEIHSWLAISAPRPWIRPKLGHDVPLIHSTDREPGNHHLRAKRPRLEGRLNVHTGYCCGGHDYRCIFSGARLGIPRHGFW